MYRLHILLNWRVIVAIVATAIYSLWQEKFDTEMVNNNGDMCDSNSDISHLCV